MLREIRPAIVVLIALTLITGLVYPLAMTGIAQILFPNQAQGGLIERDGHIVGSALIGQNFTSDKYFHGRPSATTAADPNDLAKTVPAPYNAANSGGSNLGPSNKALIDRVQADLDKLRKEILPPRSPPTWSRLRPADSIPISRQQPPTSRFPELPRRATWRKMRFVSSSAITSKTGFSGFWASRASTFCCSISRSTAYAPARRQPGQTSRH